MDKKHVAKQNSDTTSVIVSARSEPWLSQKCSFPIHPGMNRIVITVRVR